LKNPKLQSFLLAGNSFSVGKPAILALAVSATCGYRAERVFERITP
jgi:hypothetical protein